ncbi:unnamed protein product, partial [Rotaria sp. Silwood2]
SCCLGFTQSGILVLFRTISLDHSSTPSMLNVLIHLFEQHIVQIPSPLDIWDILCLIPNSNYDNSIINELVDQLVIRYDEQTIEFKRNYFTRFKQCLYHLHHLACPFSIDSCEHLTSLLVYLVLLIVRDYLRLFIYEPTNRNFVESAQEILQQTLFIQNIDIKRIKYLGDQPITIDSITVDPRQYQLITFTSLINWISDIIFYLIGYLQLQQIPQWLTCKHFFNDSRQIQWLREFIIYFYILNKMNKIPYTKIAHIQPISQNVQTSQDSQQQTTNQLTQKDILKDIYNSLSKLIQKIEERRSITVKMDSSFISTVKKLSNFDESLLEEFSVLDIEMLQSKADDLFPKPSPFLAYRLNNRCLCGGLFLFYTRSSSIINNNTNNNSNETSATATAR